MKYVLATLLATAIVALSGGAAEAKPMHEGNKVKDGVSTINPMHEGN